MKNSPSQRWFFLAQVFCILFAASCAREDDAVKREDLFSIPIGRLEGELDIFDLQSARSLNPVSFVMRDGLFYLSNGNGDKIVRYNSYGDLLFMIYNSETNPPPLTLPTTGPSAVTDTPFAQPAPEQMATRWAYAWPLSAPGAIAVDARKHIYAMDTLPPERHHFDAEHQCLENEMVLHFDEAGRFVNYLGKEGIGGSPFPHIERLFISANNSLAVLCRVPGNDELFWFDSAGMLLYAVTIDHAQLPAPRDLEGADTQRAMGRISTDSRATDRRSTASLDTVIVSNDAYELYIKVDYYHDIIDESTATMSGMEISRSCIYRMALPSGEYRAYIDVPFYELVRRSGAARQTSNLLYMLFGASAGGRLFLYFPTNDGYSLLILELPPAPATADGGEPVLQQAREIRTRLAIRNDELEYCALDVSDDGIVSALLADMYTVKMAWWRTDKLIEGTK